METKSGVFETVDSTHLREWSVLAKLDSDLLGSIVSLQVFGHNGSGALFVTSSDQVFRIGDFYKADDVDEHQFYKPSRVEPLCGQQVIKFDSGSNHSVALTRSGLVFGRGRNSSGALGRSLGDHQEFCQLEHSALSQVPDDPPVNVVCGSASTYLLSRSGRVLTWRHEYMKKASGGKHRFEEKIEDIQLEFPPGVRIASIAAGNNHAAALTTTGKVYVWGYNYHGLLGIGRRSNLVRIPQPVRRLKRVRRIACGAHHLAVVTSGHRLRIWGRVYPYNNRTVTKPSATAQDSGLFRVKDVLSINTCSQLWFTSDNKIYIPVYRVVGCGCKWNHQRWEMVYAECDSFAEAFADSPTLCLTVTNSSSSHRYRTPTNERKEQLTDWRLVVSADLKISVAGKLARHKCPHFWRMARRRLKNRCWYVGDRHTGQVWSAFVHFLYCDTLLDSLTPMDLLDLFLVAKKYRQEELKIEILKKYTRSLKPDNVVSLYQRIQELNIHELGEWSVSYMVRYLPYIIASPQFDRLPAPQAKQLVVACAKSPLIHSYSNSFFNIY